MRRPERRLHFRSGRGPERALWLQEALEGERDLPSLTGDEHAAVCIVGGGYTGLWTALRLKELEPALDVAIVEADICGGGPSGRNGGFMEPWWVKYFALKDLCGADEAVRLALATVEAIDEIERFCQHHGIDAHLRRDGWLWTASNRAQIGAWEPTIRAAAAHGYEPFRELDARELRELSGTAHHLAGILEQDGATVHPARLARGMRRVALERGVRIYEHSPVTQLHRGRPPTVKTTAGSITADRLVLAMGAWTNQVHELRNAYTTIATDMVATERMPERLAEIGLTTGVGISDSRMLINYYRTTVDGRIAWGKGGGTLAFGGWIGASLQGVSPRPHEVSDSLLWLYPNLAGVRITHSWTGPIDRSVAGLPFFSRLGGREDIVFGAGYSGNGVVPSYLGGRVLASLVLARDDEWSNAGIVRDPVGRFPPEPLRYVGGLVVRGAVARRERAEDAGGRPDIPTKFISTLAPPGPSEPRSSTSRWLFR